MREREREREMCTCMGMLHLEVVILQSPVSFSPPSDSGIPGFHPAATPSAISHLTPHQTIGYRHQKRGRGGKSSEIPALKIKRFHSTRNSHSHSQIPRIFRLETGSCRFSPLFLFLFLFALCSERGKRAIPSIRKNFH